MFLGEAFRDELVAIDAVDDGLHHVYLGQMRLGALHERTRTVVPIDTDVESAGVTHVPGHDET